MNISNARPLTTSRSRSCDWTAARCPRLPKCPLRSPRSSLQETLCTFQQVGLYVSRERSALRKDEGCAFQIRAQCFEHDSGARVDDEGLAFRWGRCEAFLVKCYFVHLFLLCSSEIIASPHTGRHSVRLLVGTCRNSCGVFASRKTCGRQRCSNTSEFGGDAQQLVNKLLKFTS